MTESEREPLCLMSDQQRRKTCWEILTAIGSFLPKGTRFGVFLFEISPDDPEAVEGRMITACEQSSFLEAVEDFLKTRERTGDGA